LWGGDIWRGVATDFAPTDAQVISCTFLSNYRLRNVGFSHGLPYIF
jgi:hypothetical protein